MAKGKKNKNMTGNSPNTQGSDNQKEKNGFLFGLFAFLVAIAVMLAVFAGAFYIVVHNNINGITTKYRKDIQNMQVLNIHYLRWALPTAPDPENPKYLSNDQLVKKYNALRKLRDDLQAQLKAANTKITELQKYKDEEDKIKAEDEKIKKDVATEKAQLDAQKNQMAEDKKKLDELIASGDSSGFKQYFEKVDPVNAQKIYADIMKQQKASDQVKKLSKLYEGMDAATAAKILEQMGDSKMDIIVGILRNMNKDAAAQILAGMSSEFSGSVTERLSKP